MGKLAVSSGLIAKVAAGTTAVAATTTIGVIYGEEISDFFYIEEDFNTLNERLRGLGLPDDCKFEENDSERNCGKLSFEKLKAINFDGKNGEITQTTDADKVVLKIKRTKDYGVFPGNIKVVFENSADVSTEGGIEIDWKRETNPEYKIEEGKLKEAWSATKLAQKVGFTACDEDEMTEECTLGTYLNVFISSDSYILGGKVTKPGKDDLKMSYESEAEGYNQGFEFKIEDNLSDIQVKSWWKTITLENGSFYEIKEQKINRRKYWFLSKKDQ